jgi:2,6-dihydroxypyridine 3-monooxygenase
MVRRGGVTPRQLELPGKVKEKREPCPCSAGTVVEPLRVAFPNANYHEGTSLFGFSQTGRGVAATFEGAGELTADILVGADGSRSFVRQKLMPDVNPNYAGYVAWRGVVLESSASEFLAKTFVDHFTFQQMERSHILC